MLYFVRHAAGTSHHTGASSSHLVDKSCHEIDKVICASTMDFTSVLELKSTGRNIRNLSVLCTPGIRSELWLLFIIGELKAAGALRVCLPDRKESGLQFIVLPVVCMLKFQNRASTSGRTGGK